MPERAYNPIAGEVRKIASRLNPVASHLGEKDRFGEVLFESITSRTSCISAQ